MKKLIAVILSVLMLLPLAALPSFAADEDMILSGDVLDAAVEAAVAELAGVPDGATYRVQSRVRQNAVAAKDLAKTFAGYIFVNPNKIDGMSDAIANDADYTIEVMENGKKTVYIAVDLREHPEVVNLDVLRAAVKKMDAKQQEVIAGEEGDIDLMSYQHIAGELALHVIIAAAMSAMGKDESDSTLSSAMVANLNKDESRFPTQLIEFLGKFIMDYIIGTLNQYIGYFFK